MVAEPIPQDLARYFAVDERGTGMRATWRPAHGFVNLSLWRDEECIETFHLSPTEAAALVSFLTHSLASSVPVPAPLCVVADPAAVADRPSRRVGDRVAAALRSGSTRLRRTR